MASLFSYVYLQNQSLKNVYFNYVKFMYFYVARYRFLNLR